MVEQAADRSPADGDEVFIAVHGDEPYFAAIWLNRDWGKTPSLIGSCCIPVRPEPLQPPSRKKRKGV